MKIFLTGATGYIGSAVLDAALRANHQVTALVRTPQAVDALASRGVTPVLGDLKTREVVPRGGRRRTMRTSTRPPTPSPKREEVDRKAIETLLGLRRRSCRSRRRCRSCTRRASGFWDRMRSRWTRRLSRIPGSCSAGGPATSSSCCRRRRPNLRTAVIRPGVVYGGNRGIVSDLLKNALNGLIRVIGTGENHWPLVYDRDLADLYVRVASMPEASGIYHANDEGDETVNAIVEGIAGHLSMTPDVRHVPLEEARKKLGAYADALALDQRVRGPRARALGWSPTLHSVGTNVPRLLEEFRRAQERAA